MRELKVQVKPDEINYVNRILEGCEYLGMVTTLDRRQGVLIVRATPDTRDEAAAILRSLPVTVRFLEEE